MHRGKIFNGFGLSLYWFLCLGFFFDFCHLLYCLLFILFFYQVAFYLLNLAAFCLSDCGKREISLDLLSLTLSSTLFRNLWLLLRPLFGLFGIWYY